MTQTILQVQGTVKKEFTDLMRSATGQNVEIKRVYPNDTTTTHYIVEGDHRLSVIEACKSLDYTFAGQSNVNGVQTLVLRSLKIA